MKWLSLAILAGKLTAMVSRTYGQGSSLPGMVARRIYPGALRDLAAQVSRGSLWSGTNGKTTTQYDCRILSEAGYKVTSNLGGSQP